MPEPKRVHVTRGPQQNHDRTNARVRGHQGPVLRKINLERYVRKARVFDHESRDLTEVRLTSFPESTTLRQINNISKKAEEIRSAYQGKHLAWVVARYQSEDDVVAAVRALVETLVEGVHIKVSYCGHRWKNPRTRPVHLYNVLEVR